MNASNWGRFWGRSWPGTTALPRPPRARRGGGFTIVELLVVMAIAAILLTIAVPSYTSTTAIYRVSTESNSLVSDLQYARSEAIKQGITVTLCASSDGQTCTGTSWQLGRIVLTNPNNAATPSLANGSTLLRATQAFSGSDTVSSGGVSAISFNRDGFAGQPSGAWNSFSSLAAPVVFTVHPTTPANADSCVVVSRIGKVSVLADGTTSTTADSASVTCT